MSIPPIPGGNDPEHNSSTAVTVTHRIIGIDPGLRHCGYGIIDSKHNQLRFIAAGGLHPVTDAPLAERLQDLYHQLTDVLQAYDPDVAAVEETFLNRNPASTLKLGQARGVALLAPALYGLSVHEYSAKRIKQSVTGAGAAGKDQIKAMVKMLLPGADPTSYDAADALAVAICHAHHAPALEQKTTLEQQKRLA